MMGSYSRHFWVMMGVSWDHFRIMLWSFWHHAGTNEIHPKCCGADFGSRIKISGNFLGQNDQNFDIYPFDWSQVASWGLAAEGEALTIKWEHAQIGCGGGNSHPIITRRPPNLAKW